MSASVKVMLSYDYCHFEVCKSTDENVTDEQIDAMRKDVQRLADKAVRQYKIAKNALANKHRRQAEWDELRRQVSSIETKAEGDRTPNEQAKVKLLRDRDWQAYIETRYDYEDDYPSDDDY